MTFLVAGAFFVFGTIIGSFLNVVVLRYGTGRSLGGRSRCASCGKKLPWHDLIPFVSFLALRGRCRFCRSRFSVQYPLVESITGLLFLGAFLKHFSHVFLSIFTIYYLLFTIHLVVFCLLVVIAVYDLRHKIIPDAFVWTFAAFSLAALFIARLHSFPPDVSDWLNLAAGPFLALPFFLLWLISRGRWIGLGDAKLALGVGWFLGLVGGLSALVIGFWIGATASLALLGLSRLKASAKHLTMKSEIPLAPFLIAGFFIVYFFHLDVMNLGAFM